MRIVSSLCTLACIAAAVVACTPREPARYLALAFDDGPNMTTESALLDVLEKYDVPATFFLIGSYINDETAEIMKRAVNLGCELGNHSFNHTQMSRLNEAQVKKEIDATSDMIEKITGKRPVLFRPPYINTKPELFDWIDLTFICGKDIRDWMEGSGKDDRFRGILDNAEPGAIYLLHDFVGNDATVEALDEAIPLLKEQGYTFVTISQMFEKQKHTPDGHTMYSVVPDERKR